jgi:hypothetical protein
MYKIYKIYKIYKNYILQMYSICVKQSGDYIFYTERILSDDLITSVSFARTNILVIFHQPWRHLLMITYRFRGNYCIDRMQTYVKSSDVRKSAEWELTGSCRMNI